MANRYGERKIYDQQLKKHVWAAYDRELRADCSIHDTRKTARQIARVLNIEDKQRKVSAA